MKLLGMQIMVEGLALAAFGMIRAQTSEPLLKKLTHYVMLDEARHVAYGVLSLKNHYDDMKESERLEREDFIYEAAVLMRDRFLYPAGVGEDGDARRGVQADRAPVS